MAYSEDQIEKLQTKLKKLRDLYEFQVSIGEKTSVTEGKIRELETILEGKK